MLNRIFYQSSCPFHLRTTSYNGMSYIPLLRTLFFAFFLLSQHFKGTRLVTSPYEQTSLHPHHFALITLKLHNFIKA